VEGDFQFSSLKRKWLEEEGKFLSGELRRAQDLCVQQEMELESLRQQNAALGRLLSQVLLLLSRLPPACTATCLPLSSCTAACLPACALPEEWSDPTVFQHHGHLCRRGSTEEQMRGAALKLLCSSQCLRRRPMQHCRWLPPSAKWPCKRASAVAYKIGVQARLSAGQEEVGMLRSLEAERARAADGLQSEVDALRGQLKSAQAQAAHVAELEQEAQHLRESAARIPGLEAALREERAAAEGLRRQVAEGATAASGDSASAARLREELEAARAEAAGMPALQERLQQAEAQLSRVADLQGALAEAEKRNRAAAERLGADVLASAGRTAALEAEAAAARAQAQQVQAQLGEAREALARQRAELAGAQAALAERDASSASLEQAKVAAEAKAAQLEAELRQVRADSGGDSAAQGAASASAASSDAAQAAAQLAAAQADAAALRQSLEAAVARADGHYHAIQQMNAQVQVGAPLRCCVACAGANAPLDDVGQHH
jgi:hypothetical protein